MDLTNYRWHIGYECFSQLLYVGRVRQILSMNLRGTKIFFCRTISMKGQLFAVFDMKCSERVCIVTGV